LSLFRRLNTLDHTPFLTQNVDQARRSYWSLIAKRRLRLSAVSQPKFALNRTHDEVLLRFFHILGGLIGPRRAGILKLVDRISENVETLRALLDLSLHVRPVAFVGIRGRSRSIIAPCLCTRLRSIRLRLFNHLL